MNAMHHGAAHKPCLRGELRINEPMARHTSWRVGGPADRWYRPADAEDLSLFLQSLRPDEPVLWVGLGSNLLVRDGGIRGTVISIAGVMDALERLPGERVRAGAGVSCARLSRFCSEQNLAGGEFLAGIPGALGGALAMNAGAWGGETWSHVVEIRIMDRRGDLHLRMPGEFEVGYRSVQGLGDACFIEAVLAFEPGSADVSRARARELLAQRNERQPIGLPSCGSVFRNPPGDHAARLIEAAGLKGLCIGGAQVSPRHANFIINTGDARAADIEALIHHVQEKVLERHGVHLCTEVRMVGEAAGEART